jgi:hypothetical protein
LNLPNLYLVQDADRPLYVLASDFAAALRLWQAQIEFENDLASDTEAGEPDQAPHGVQLIARGWQVLQAKPVDDQRLREQLVQLVQRMGAVDKNGVPTRCLAETNSELVDLARDVVAPLLETEKRAGRLEDWLASLSNANVAGLFGDLGTAERIAAHALGLLRNAAEPRQAQGGAS